VSRKTPDTIIGRFLAIAVNLVLVIAFVWGVIHFFRTASWGKILFVTIFFAVILLLTFLAVVFPRVDKTIRAAISFYGSFIYWYFVTTAPILFFFWFAPRVLVMSKTLKWAVFVAWGLLLIFGSLTVFTEKYRNRFFPWLQRKVGKFAPCAYALNLLFIAWLFFSSVTYVLVKNDVLKLDRPAVAVSSDGAKPAPAEVTADHIKDFYAWHFLQAIPLLKVNETLNYKAPLTYSGAGVGWLLLMFQLMVILPVTRAFVWYWKHDEPAARRAVVVYRASAPKKGADKD
jgi:hypothetical protein